MFSQVSATHSVDKGVGMSSGVGTHILATYT